MITIEWWNSTDFANTVYSRGFKNKVILDTYLGLPELIEVTVGDSDGEGGIVPSFQKRAKQYRFEVFVPEYMVDTLTDIQLHDNINVTDHNGIVYPVNNRNTWEVEKGNWIGKGCTKQITIAFQTGERVIRTNCPENSCPPTGATCESVMIIEDLNAWAQFSFWKTLALTGGFNDVDLSAEMISIYDSNGLAFFLNTLGLGEWIVTGSSMPFKVTNTQPKPAQYSFISMCFEDGITGNTPCFPFVSDC